jgi:carbonic anhydrase
VAGAVEAAGPQTPQEALERLLAGNGRFVAGELTGVRGIAEQRAELASGQKPFAVVLTCSDSRVPPELVFDQGLGDLFVCRVAGNVLEPTILGSIEYAVASFDPKLVVVMGHERCGAVTEAVELVASGRTTSGSIQAVIDAIAPVVRSTERGSQDTDDYVDAVVRANVARVAQTIARESAIAGKALLAARLQVVEAVYALESGRVGMLKN